MSWPFASTKSPVQIIQGTSSDEANMITLDETILSNILTQKRVKDKLISVVSVVGTYRQGKSYLLNFMHRYLKHKYPNKGINEWLVPTDGPLQNVFSAASGSNRQTNGIRMSQDIFLVETEAGEVAIFLLDTQGSFDNQSTITDSAKIFTISSLISSVQVYNLKRGFTSYDIDHLRLFATYAASAANSECKMFQDIWFLIRDWQWEFEYSYGVQGGEEYMEKFFQKNQEVQDNMTAIKTLFNSVKCFLMPHPGKSVATSEYFNGNLNDINEKFRRQIMTFIPMLLSLENLVLKKVNDNAVTAGEFFQIIQSYNEVLRNEEAFPELDSFSKIMSKTYHSTSKDKAFASYKNELKKFLDQDGVKLSSLREAHANYKDESLKLYQERCKKLGDEDIYEEYLKILENEIDEEFGHHENIIKARKGRMVQKVQQICRVVGNIVQAGGTVVGLCLSATNPVTSFVFFFGSSIVNTILHKIKPSEEN